MKCLLCNGSGEIDEPKKKDLTLLEVKKEIAIKLKGRGYSYRQIQKALGYKSVRSVSYLLK